MGSITGTGIIADSTRRVAPAKRLQNRGRFAFKFRVIDPPLLVSPISTMRVA
jgi:hypothetical protein